MNSNTRTNGPTGYAWKIPVIAFAYFFGVMISGGVITALDMPWPAIEDTSSQATQLLTNLIGAVLVAFCVALLAAGLRGSTVRRALILSTFTYVTLGLNNQIEAAIFTTLGGTTTMIIFFILPCLLGGLTAAALIKPLENEDLVSVFSSSNASQWRWRLTIAWLAFPLIYLFFGMLVAPFVVPVYQTQDFGLVLPGFGIMLPVALGRSALYLAVTIPIIVGWTRSRRSLMVALGLSFFAMMGLIGLVSATFFPPVLRIAHSLEILGDAIVYAWLLVALFVPRARAETAQTIPATVD